MQGVETRLAPALMSVMVMLAANGETQAGEPEPPPDGVGSGQDAADTSLWVCRLCPYPLGWFGVIDFGTGYVSDSSLKFGSYRGLEEKGPFLALGGEVHYRDATGRYYDLYARDLGIESRLLEMRGGEQGRYEVRFAYGEIPFYRGYGTRTPYRGLGGGTLRLPEDWVHAPTTGQMSALDGALQEVLLKTKRKTLDAGLSLRGASRWSWEIDFQHQNKNGTRPYGGGVFLINSSHLPAPVDFTTNLFDMGLAYTGDRSHLRVGVMGSDFDNGTPSLAWDNPFIPISGTGSLQAALEPDNRYYQFNLAGAWSPNPKVRLSGRAATGRMSQDDPFLPYTRNPEFSDLPLPRQSLDGRIDTSVLNLAGRFSARLSRRFDVTAWIKLDERDNRTPVALYTPVITDLVLRDPRPNRPYSFEREKYGLALRYRTRRAARLAVGLARETIERDLQSVSETREDTLWGEVSVNRWSKAQLRLRLESSERHASDYRPLQDGGPLEHPLMRKFNLADRERLRVRFELDLAPLDRLGVNLTYFKSADDYGASTIGLQESEDQSIGVDLSWSINTYLQFHAHVNRQDIDSSLTGAADLGTDFWRAASDDRFVTAGLGAQFRVGSNISVGFDYLAADSEGRVATDSGLQEDPFPLLRTDLRNARVHVSYRAGDRWGWKIFAEHESYDSEDWYVDDLGPAGIPAILTLGPFSPDYDVTVLRALASYRF